MSTNYYIYCIANKDDKELMLEALGHDKEDVFTISYGELCAYISKSQCTRYDPTLENLQCHENVISNVMRDQAVLPFSFSTICKNKEAVYLMLKKYYDQFSENLKKVEGKVELGLKIFYKLSFEEEGKLDKEQYKSAKEYMAKRFNRYKERKKKMESIMIVADTLHSNLCRISKENTFKKPLRNNLIFNGAYLVEKDKIEEFYKIVEGTKKACMSYKIICSGPWAPYHFTSIVEEGEDNE